MQSQQAHGGCHEGPSSQMFSLPEAFLAAVRTFQVDVVDGIENDGTQFLRWDGDAVLGREMSGHLDDVSKLRQCEEQMKKDLMQRKEDVER